LIFKSKSDGYAINENHQILKDTVEVGWSVLLLEDRKQYSAQQNNSAQNSADGGEGILFATWESVHGMIHCLSMRTLIKQRSQNLALQ